MMDKANKFHIIEWLTTIGVIIGCFIWLLAKMENIESRMDGNIYLVQESINQQNIRIDQQNSRSDQLYTMFIDLIKESKKG